MTFRFSDKLPVRIIARDRVRTESGRTGRVLLVHGQEAEVHWDNDSVFWIRVEHLTLIEGEHGSS